jgi:hypothetical protein
MGHYKKTDGDGYCFEDVSFQMLCCDCNVKRLEAKIALQPLYDVPCASCYSKDSAYFQSCFGCPCESCRQPVRANLRRRKATTGSETKSINHHLTHFFHLLRNVSPSMAFSFLPVFDKLFRSKLCAFSCDQLQQCCGQDLLDTYARAIENLELMPTMPNWEWEHKRSKARQKEDHYKYHPDRYFFRARSFQEIADYEANSAFWVEHESEEKKQFREFLEKQIAKLPVDDPLRTFLTEKLAKVMRIIL